MTRLMKKGVAFRWFPEQQLAFETLRQKLCEASVLSLQEGVDDIVILLQCINQGFPIRSHAVSSGNRVCFKTIEAS